MVDGLSTSAPIAPFSRDPLPFSRDPMGSAADTRSRPRLLVSVRSAAEAAAALAGGADIIDIKEPEKGPLGMADVRVIADVLDCIAGRGPVSAALGEAREWLCFMGATGSASVPSPLPSGLSFTKLGLAGLGRHDEWVRDWLTVRDNFEHAAGRPLPWVAVAYADVWAADAPPVSEVIQAAAATGCRGVLIDTFDKRAAGILTLIPPSVLREWTSAIRNAGLFCALAGRLRACDLSRHTVRQCDIVGVRSAACREGARSQSISTRRLSRLRDRLNEPVAIGSDCVRNAAQYIRAHWARTPAAALILGTGMSGLAAQIEIEGELDVCDVPHFRRTTALGHRGRIVCGLWNGVPVIALEGRCHRYEGCSNSRVAFPVRVMRHLGARVLIATNAAGGLNPAFRVGDVMLIDDVINLMRRNRSNSLSFSRDSKRSAPNVSTLQPQFAAAARAAALDAGFTAHSGTYVGVVGPNYETRAEYRLFRAMGGDAVGMSTIPELRAAAKVGMQSLALSVITNVANPDALEPADCESVIHAAESAAARVTAIINGVIACLPHAS